MSLLTAVCVFFCPTEEDSAKKLSVYVGLVYIVGVDDVQRAYSASGESFESVASHAAQTENRHAAVFEFFKRFVAEKRARAYKSVAHFYFLYSVRSATTGSFLAAALEGNNPDSSVKTTLTHTIITASYQGKTAMAAIALTELTIRLTTRHRA